VPEDCNVALLDAWESFCDRVKMAGRLAFRHATSDTPPSRASGVRYMARV
jgi:hypothetical protein